MLRFETGNLVTGNYPIFCHQVNCHGKMASGIAKQIREKYPEVYDDFILDAFIGCNVLGTIITTKTKDGRLCISMYGQDEYGHGKCFTDYKAFKECLGRIKARLEIDNNTDPIAFPYKIGCGLAGGDWNVIYTMLDDFSKTVEQDVIIVTLKE